MADMVLNAYSLLDTKTGVHSPPFFMAHDAQALRAVLELGRDVNTTPGKYPDDYVLYRLGYFDDNTGSLSSLAPFSLGSVAAVLGAFSVTTREVL